MTQKKLEKFKKTGASFTSNVKSSFRIIRKSRASLAGFIIIVAFTLMASIGPNVFPYDRTPHVADRYLPPSWEHLLGTDWAGRDTLAQIINGSREVLIVAFLAAIFTTTIAFVIGISSGFIGGKTDTLLMLGTDIFLVVPQFPLLLIIVTTIPRFLSPPEIALILGIVGWATLARGLRAQVLSMKEKEFIESARCLGLSRFHILFREILPNLLPYIAMSLIFSIIGAIYSQVGLYFIGAMPITVTNWGVMIQTAIGHGALINPDVWPYLFSPLICLILIQTGFILFLHSLEEIFNPRLRTEA